MQSWSKFATGRNEEETVTNDVTGATKPCNEEFVAVAAQTGTTMQINVQNGNVGDEHACMDTMGVV